MSLVHNKEVGSHALQPFDFTLVANGKPFRGDVQELEGTIGQQLIACRLLLLVYIAVDEGPWELFALQLRDLVAHQGL
jgi:hypothetical protein